MWFDRAFMKSGARGKKTLATLQTRDVGQVEYWIVQEILDQLGDHRILWQGHRNTWSKQRRRTPRGPIYQHAFKYSLYSAVQLQPCCSSVAGRRLGLHSEDSSAREQSHTQMWTSYFSSHAFANSNSIFPAVFLCVMPPGCCYCEMLFTKVVSFWGIYIYLDWVFPLTPCGIKLGLPWSGANF